MDNKFYKYCIVPQCESTTIKTPKKLFVHVPRMEEMRKKWLQLARRDVNVASDSRIYFCEDHFDLPNDMENYIEYVVMGFVPKIRMKQDTLPSKFDCQPDKRKQAGSTLERPCALKRQRMAIIEESIKESVESNNANTSSIQREMSVTSPGLHMIKEDLQEVSKTANKCIQVLLTKKYRSKTTQTQRKSVDQAVSPFRYCKTVSTSPFKVECAKLSRPSASGISKKIFWEEENSNSDFSPLMSPVTHSGTSPSTESLQTKSSDGSEIVKVKQKPIETAQYIINTIIKKPMLYIGIPKSYYFLLDIINNKTNIPIEHLMLCLKKIRLDSTFREIADDFAMVPSYASKIFFKNVPILASVLRPFIVKIDKELTRKSLPISFRHKYHNVNCIIDCLEIEVQKPTKRVHQALTWSDYKNANTIKYLISCTPNGLVNYISPGFGGRITDTCLVEYCDFVHSLEKGMCVMADQGFKNVEQILLKSGVQLVRPSSVQSGIKLSKFEATPTKQITMDRVIRRLQEFRMLRPLECVNMNYVKILDDIVTIACGLINLQDSPIK